MVKEGTLFKRIVGIKDGIFVAMNHLDVFQLVGGFKTIRFERTKRKLNVNLSRLINLCVKRTCSFAVGRVDVLNRQVGLISYYFRDL